MGAQETTSGYIYSRDNLYGHALAHRVTIMLLSSDPACCLTRGFEHHNHGSGGVILPRGDV